jgi:hypothetical protein
LISKGPSSNTVISRQDLNLKTPKKKVKQEKNESQTLKSIENNIFSPMKLLEQTLRERTKKMDMKGTEHLIFDEKVVERVRQKTRRPKPLCEKKKIVE